jgi:hypothetical protein
MRTNFAVLLGFSLLFLGVLGYNAYGSTGLGTYDSLACIGLVIVLIITLYLSDKYPPAEDQ